MRIYTFNNKLILDLCENCAKELKIPAKDVIKWLFQIPHSYNTLSLYFSDDMELSAYVNEFTNNFTRITAAGGIVMTPDRKHILMIRRQGMWDLPKGKIEAEEQAKAAAIREVEEETNCQNLKVIKSYDITTHLFNKKQKLYLKTTHWFLMEAPKEQNFIAQKVENIEKVSWKTINNVLNLYPIHRLVSDLIQQVKKDFNI